MDRKSCYRLIMLLTLFLALLFGLYNITAGWAVFGIVGFIFICVGFPHAWKYAIWLVGIYLFAGLGAILITLPDILTTSFGLVTEILAFFILLSLIYRVTSIRDSVNENLPLGIWFLSLLLFFLCSNLALFSWASWAMERGDLSLYSCAEIALILLVLYILWVPEEKLGKGIKLLLKCPVCGSLLRAEPRVCPVCRAESNVYFCRKEEHYVTRCFRCMELTPYGEECVNCGVLVKEIKCTACGEQKPLEHWE